MIFPNIKLVHHAKSKNVEINFVQLCQRLENLDPLLSNIK